jgi:hypothetical protein
MAQLFVEAGSGWLVAPLDGDAHALVGDAELSLRPRPAADAAVEDAPVIQRESDASGEGETWVVIHTPGSALRINGTALATGLRVLSHRDELRLAGVAGRVFVSLEGLARIALFDGTEGSRCPRCQQAIQPGSPAVRCPQCGVWHHQSQELGCWSYSPACSLCSQPTELEAGFRWTPDEGAGHD